MNNLRDKVALVTGGTSGIGLACARALVEAGAKVAICGRDERRGAAAIEALAPIGEAAFIHADIRSKESVVQLINTTLTRFGRLDLAVNSAGWGPPPQPFLDIEEETWLGVVGTNLSGTFYCMQEEIRAMLSNAGDAKGDIINISSLAWEHTPFPGFSAYASSKGGMYSLSRSAAREFAHSGININMISPAAVETNILDAISESLRAELENRHPVGRIGRPEEIASAVLWLVSGSCRFMTGHNMIIDGGISLL